MTKKKPAPKRTIQRPKRVKLSAKESLRRMEAFEQRKEAFVAAVRKGTDRSVST